MLWLVTSLIPRVESCNTPPHKLGFAPVVSRFAISKIKLLISWMRTIQIQVTLNWTHYWVAYEVGSLQYLYWNQLNWTGSLKCDRTFFTVIFSSYRESIYKEARIFLFLYRFIWLIWIAVCFWLEKVFWLFFTFSFESINGNYPICSQRGKKVIDIKKSTSGKAWIIYHFTKSLSFSTVLNVAVELNILKLYIYFPLYCLLMFNTPSSSILK